METSCNRFDKRGRGRLTVEEYYNVLKLQNKLDTSKDEIKKLVEDLDMDKDGQIKIKVRNIDGGEGEWVYYCT